MKKELIITFTVFVLSLSSAFAQINNFSAKADVFLSKYVSNGRVNYTVIKNNPTSLDELVELIATQNIKVINETERKAYLINVYNILVIYQIIEAYPISSPMDVPDFFDQNKFDIGGEKMTLNYLENEVIRATYKDPRLHFVLVCGAIGCPVLENFAYSPDKVEAQIEAQTKKAINNSEFVKIDKANATVMLSEIFKWYAEDFRLESKTDIEYINKYREVVIPDSCKTRFYSYDWSLNELLANGFTAIENLTDTSYKTNLQTYTAGSLLKKGQIDISMFNNIYSQTKANWAHNNYSTGNRETFTSSLIQFTYGVSKNARFNVGIDLNLKASAISSDTSFSSITTPFRFQNNDSMRAGIAYIAPKIKFSPFKGNNDFSIQSTFITTLPFLVKNPEGSDDLSWIEWDRYIWWTQLFYSKSFAKDKLQLFTELDLLFRFAKWKTQSSHLEIPVSVFISYFPTKKLTLYVMTQHVPRFVFGNNNLATTDWVVNANYTQSGIGMKYQILPSVNIELLYTNFWRSINNGQGETFNLGIKYVH
ncbi:MAG: DUF547 domain-containing protein [Flavobacteriales bacterium]|nr:DUF547 domain-containing protein [Flavobacteriales bacterium]